MESGILFFRRASGTPRRLGILPGTFNPPTTAHLELAHAAAAIVDEVLFVLPRALPHKEFLGATFAERIDMLMGATEGHPQYSIATLDRGLFVEIAAACRQAYGDDVRLSFLCGRDAAERIAGWDYGRPNAFAEMLREFDLLVAARQGEYPINPEFQHAIAALPVACDLDSVSATAVRERIAGSEPWEHLVPESIRERARRIYARPCDR